MPEQNRMVMDVTEEDGAVVLTVDSDEELEITIRITVESDEEPEYYEPEYIPNVIDVAAYAVADSFTSLFKVFAGLFVLGLFLSLFE